MDSAGVNEAQIIRRERAVLGLVSAAHFFSHFFILALPLLFLAIKSEYGVSFKELGLITALYGAGSAIGQYPMGVLADRFGPRWFMICGMIVVSAAYILMGVSESYWPLVVLALLAGLGDSIFHPTDFIVITASIRQERLGRAYAFHAFMGFAGFAAAPLIVDPLRSNWDWHVAAMVCGALGLVMALLLLLSKNLLIGEASKEGDNNEASATAPNNRSLGALAFLRSPPLLMLFLFYIAAALAGNGIQQFTPSALPIMYGIDESWASRALLGFGLGIALGVLAGGIVAEKSSKLEIVATVSYLIAIILVLMVAFMRMPAPVIVLVIFATGFMTGIVMPSRDLLVRSVAPKGASGKAFGFVNSGFGYGAIAGPLIFGWIMDSGYIPGLYIGSGVFMAVVIVTALAAAHLARPHIAEQAAE